jgi:DNA-binding transcriptional ArsR family regulator
VSDAKPSGASLEAAAGAAGPHATEAFALLGDETRLSILLALWEEYDPHADDHAVPFSRIFERIDYEDPGNLRYHLEKLRGPFIEQHAEREGYELRETGLKLVRAVIAGAGVSDVTRDATEIDQSCPLCGAPTAVRYRDGLVIHACTECEGPTPEATDVEGFLSAVPFEPAGLADRTPEEIRVASWVAARRQVHALFDRLCPSCSGTVDGWLECCAEHDSTGICERCGRKFGSWARFQCRTCKNHSVSSPKALALFHPAVIAFYDDHGVSTRVRADDFESAKRVFGLMDAHAMELVAREPPRVAVTASLEGDEICLTFDKTVSVVDVRR